MLTLDLGLLAKRRRIRIETDLPADSELWSSLPWQFDDVVRLSLDVQQAGADVVVRGRIEGRVRLACRRCLGPVYHDLAEDVVFVYRPGLAEVDAEAEEVYALPARGTALDLGPAIREHVLLAVPQYVICAESCRGFCPQCGTNLNEASCDCVAGEPDPRWAALRRTRIE